MAKFKIELETDIGRVILTDFDSKNENNLEMTFDESLEEGENDTYTLSFSIPKKIDKIPIGNLIVISRPLWLTFGNPQRSIRMIISAINENRGEENIIYEVEAQDYASYVYSKNNAGLSFDSFEDEEFLNIMEKKWDAEIPSRPKDDRKPEITDIADYLLERGWLKKGVQGWSSEYVRESDPFDPTPQDEYLKYVNIEVDNSNTYNALLELANAAQALVRFDYAGQVVSFIDKENASLDKKFLLREDFNLQELSLSKEGNELFGVLYVDGIQDENDEYTFMEDEIAYRDNFLYDLEYFKDAGLLTLSQIQEIKDRFEDGGDDNSLISINVKLEEAIKQRRELEGQIYEAETAFMNLTDTLIVEPTIEDFSKNYDLFWKRFVKTVVDYGESGDESEVYKYEDFLDVSFVKGGLLNEKILSAVPFDLNKMLVKINNSYLMFASDTEEETTGTAKVRFATNLFEIKLSTKASVTGFTNKGNLLILEDMTVSIFVKNDKEGLWQGTYNNEFSIEKAWFKLFLNKNSYKRIKTYPYFDLVYRLGGRKLIEKKIKEWVDKIDDIKEEWEAAAQELEDLMAGGEPSAGTDLIEYEQRKAYLEDLMESFKAGIGGYEKGDNGLWTEEQPMGRYKLIRDTLEYVLDLADEEDRYLTNNENILYKFFDLMAQKREFWFDLKALYGTHIFTEGYYEDEVETNSLTLYHQAKRAQKEHNKPLEQIQATYINISDIIGIDILEPRVGDYIWIEKRDGVLQTDQKLKIEGISRTLRLDGNIEYEIAKFSPGNRLIEKLVKQLQG